MSTKDTLRWLVKNGHLRRFSADAWNGFTEAQMLYWISKGWKNPPRAFASVTIKQKNLLRSYHAQGLLRGFYLNDLDDLTEREAAFLIGCAEDNRWTCEKGYQDSLRKTISDNESATPKQLRQIIDLGKAGYLNRISINTLLKITRLSANRLIWRGEMNRKENRNLLPQHTA